MAEKILAQLNGWTHTSVRPFLCPWTESEELEFGNNIEVVLLDSTLICIGVPMFYGSASNQLQPCFYICPVRYMQGRAQPSFHASLATTAVIPFNTAAIISASSLSLRTAGVLKSPRLTQARSRIRITAADSMMRTSERGVVAARTAPVSW